MRKEKSSKLSYIHRFKFIICNLLLWQTAAECWSSAAVLFSIIYLYMSLPNLSKEYQQH